MRPTLRLPIFFVTVFGLFWLFSRKIVAEPLDLYDYFKDTVGSGDIALPLIMAFFAGFLTFLSPCIYPLIPITLSIIGVRRYESHLQAFLVSFSYICGMSVLYTVLGALFASIGIMLGALMQHPFILLMIAVLLSIFALSMLGVFNIVLPASVTTKLTKIGGQGKRGAFLMGLVAGVIAAPCTGPILGFILALIAGQKNIFFGSSLMLMFSFGMGVPFLMLGTFSSTIMRMPKSGTWMDRVKFIFGSAMLGAAFYYFALVLDPLQQLLIMLGQSLWLVMGGFLTGGALLLGNAKRPWALALGASLLALSVASLLSSSFNAQPELEAKLPWHIIDSSADESTLSRVLKIAKTRNAPVMMDFYAEWCVACKQLEQKTFNEPAVANTLKNFVLVRIDSTKTSNYLASLQTKFKVIGLPTVVFLNQKGELVPDATVIGFIKAGPFLERLKRVE